MKDKIERDIADKLLQGQPSAQANEIVSVLAGSIAVLINAPIGENNERENRIKLATDPTSMGTFKDFKEKFYDHFTSNLVKNTATKEHSKNPNSYNQSRAILDSMLFIRAAVSAKSDLESQGYFQDQSDENRPCLPHTDDLNTFQGMLAKEPNQNPEVFKQVQELATKAVEMIPSLIQTKWQDSVARSPGSSKMSR